MFGGTVHRKTGRLVEDRNLIIFVEDIRAIRPGFEKRPYP